MRVVCPYILVVHDLDINRELHTGVSNSADPIISAIQKYKNHPSILKLNERMPIVTFNFKPVSEKDIKYIIQNVDSTKAFQKDDIPLTILKANEDICSLVLTSDINRCVVNGTFPNNLKNADITLTFKKNDRLLKSNYRHVSILTTLSKIYEKILYKQICEYFNIIFSKYLCGFRKGYSTQHYLLHMLEYLKKALDKGMHPGILLTDLIRLSIVYLMTFLLLC